MADMAARLVRAGGPDDAECGGHDDASFPWVESGCVSGLLLDRQQNGLAVQAAGVGVVVHGRSLFQGAAVGNLDA